MIFEAPGGGGAGGFIEICRASWANGGSGGGGGGTLNKNVGWGGYPAGTISSSAGSFGYVAQAGTGSGDTPQVKLVLFKLGAQMMSVKVPQGAGAVEVLEVLAGARAV